MSRRAAAGALALLAACAPARPDAPAPVAVWVTTADRAELLARRPDVAPVADTPASRPVVDVDDAVRHQEIVGFGAAVTGSAAWLLHARLDAARRDSVLRALFSPDAGIGLSLVRVTMGASDFSLRSFTYDDVPVGARDTALARFSIDADRADVIPTLRRAREINPVLRVIATPWSPPAWMKTSGSLNGGSLRRDAYPVYARYFRRYVDALAAEGIALFAVTPQNEPHHEAAYPSTRMTAAEQTTFVRDHLGPALTGPGMPRILAWDHNWDAPEYPLHVLADAGARRYVAGAAFHCYAGDPSAQSRVHDAFPDAELYMTECAGGAWAPDFGDNLRWNVRTLIVGTTRHWSRGTVLWNLALDPAHGPTNGGCTNCRGVVTIDPATGGVTYNEEYYALGHASRFVRPGARRVASTTFDGGIETVAFRNPDGSVALVAVNAADGPLDFRVRRARRSFDYTLPGRAVATFVWR